MEPIENKTDVETKTFKDVADTEWRDLCDAVSIIMNKLFVFSCKTYSQEVYNAARDEFFFKEKDKTNIFLDTEDKAFLKVMENGFFIPWYLFNYNVGAEGKFETIASRFFNIDEITTEEQYLTKYQESVFIALHDTPYAILEVVEINPLQSITFRDVLLDKVITVKEYSGSQIARKGSLFYGKILTSGNTSILVTSCNFTILEATKLQMIHTLQEIADKVAQSPSPYHALKAPGNDNALRNLFFGWALSQVKDIV